MKAKTIDQLAGKPAGSFKKFIKEKEAFLQGLEAERKERIRATRKAALELSWAA
jgi:hypothetical protein